MQECLRPPDGDGLVDGGRLATAATTPRTYVSQASSSVMPGASWACTSRSPASQACCARSITASSAGDFSRRTARVVSVASAIRCPAMASAVSIAPAQAGLGTQLQRSRPTVPPTQPSLLSWATRKSVISSSDGSWLSPVSGNPRKSSQTDVSRASSSWNSVSIMNIRPLAACRTVKLHGGSVVDEAIRGHRHENPCSQYAVSGAVATSTSMPSRSIWLRIRSTR